MTNPRRLLRSIECESFLHRRTRIITTLCSFLACSLSSPSWAQSPVTGEKVAEKIIIDTDIGGDIDDAFAIALALQSPEMEILGISTASGNTVARAKILDRMLGESGREEIPVAVGLSTQLPNAQIGAQVRYGEGGHYARSSHPAAAEFILSQIKRFPGQITLVTIGPLSNIGEMIDKDAINFRKLKRVVMMGGWIRAVDVAGSGELGPYPETNVVLDISSAKKLFQSGVDIYLMPVDATIHLALDEVSRRTLFYQATPTTDALALLYLLWVGEGAATPILNDAMAVAFVTNPKLCPVEPMRILVDDKGMTRDTTGAQNIKVCLHSDQNKFIDYFLSRLVTPSNSQLSKK